MVAGSIPAVPAIIAGNSAGWSHPGQSTIRSGLGGSVTYAEHTVFYEGPARPSLVIVTDCRAKSDAELDERHAGTHVLHLWKAGREALGREYAHVGRLALFEHGIVPTSVERQAARLSLLERLAALSAQMAVVVPTSDQDDCGLTQIARTVSWPAFEPPDGIAAVRGCVCGDAGKLRYMAIWPRLGTRKQLEHAQQATWLRVAHDVATGKREVLQMPTSSFHLWKTRPLAVDIESVEGRDCIMCIGVSDGIHSWSCPWDEYVPHGHEQAYPGGTDEQRDWLRELLASDVSKVFHNWTFDVPQLRARGLHVGGEIHDTFAASAIVAPELKHGLQHACARELIVPPWKSMWHPKLKGYSKDDAEFWTCDPDGLRAYNASDAFYTWHLASNLLPKVGVKWD